MELHKAHCHSRYDEILHLEKARLGFAQSFNLWAVAKLVPLPPQIASGDLVRVCYRLALLVGLVGEGQLTRGMVDQASDVDSTTHPTCTRT